jgi:hypothetical protein
MKFSNNKIFLTIIGLLVISNIASTRTECHPQCSWKCDDPHCPAICDPVCEPPKCHTSCAEPRNAICDVKCEKPECEIKCPDKGCEMFDCPKCVTVCKQPHCVTHCQAPKPECEAVCEEPRCDWKCHKPACPKPKCELVCENPNCVPKVECCPCAQGAARVSQPFPFFKEVESNKECCSCNKNKVSEPRFKEVHPENSIYQPQNQPSGAGKNYNNQNRLISSVDAHTRTGSTVNDFGTHVVTTTEKDRIDTFKIPKQIGNSYYENPVKDFAEFESKPLTFSVGKQ